MKSIKLFLTVLILFFVLAASCTNDKKIESGADIEVSSVDNSAKSNEPVIIAAPESSDVNKVFILTGKNFRFYMDGKESPELKVKQGDKVRVELKGEQGMHDFVIDELNVRTQKISAPSSTSIEFLANKKGTFEYYCSVGSHRQMGMKGNFIVE